MDRLRDALLAARSACKPVTIVKVGHTTVGARAAKLHTGSDTGDAAEYRRMFDACGVRSVRSISELFSVAVAQEPPVEVRGKHLPVAIFSISGGVGIMMADRAEELGLALPPLPDDAAKRLKDAIPFASTINPIDVTAQVFSQPAVLVQALRDAATCGRYRYVAAFLAAAGNAPGVWPLLQECIAQLRADPGAARLVLSGILTGEQSAWLEANGCAVFAEPAEAIDAIEAMVSSATAFFRTNS
jgi:acyl-CoA synthetase (NDP forming)